jgi:hypothetical protein
MLSSTPKIHVWVPVLSSPFGGAYVVNGGRYIMTMNSTRTAEETSEQSMEFSPECLVFTAMNNGLTIFWEVLSPSNTGEFQSTAQNRVTAAAARPTTVEERGCWQLGKQIRIPQFLGVPDHELHPFQLGHSPQEPYQQPQEEREQRVACENLAGEEKEEDRVLGEDGHVLVSWNKPSVFAKDETVTDAYGQSCADEEQTRSELGFPTHALDSSSCTRITHTQNHNAAEFYRFLH